MVFFLQPGTQRGSVLFVKPINYFWIESFHPPRGQRNCKFSGAVKTPDSNFSWSRVKKATDDNKTRIFTVITVNLTPQTAWFVTGIIHELPSPLSDPQETNYWRIVQLFLSPIHYIELCSFFPRGFVVYDSVCVVSSFSVGFSDSSYQRWVLMLKLLFSWCSNTCTGLLQPYGEEEVFYTQLPVCWLKLVQSITADLQEILQSWKLNIKVLLKLFHRGAHSTLWSFWVQLT